MSTSAAGEGSSYGGGGGGAGGKFQKKILRKTRNTPYDRPPSIISGGGTNSKNGWLSKLVDPASKLITASAHRLFGSVFRKRLPPPPPPAPLQPRQLVSDTKQESLEKFHQTSPNEIISVVNRPGLQQQSINDSVNLCRKSDNSGFVELEQILKQKTFSRSEIDHLTSLLHSRTPGMPKPHAENGSDSNCALVAHDREVEPAKSPLLENGFQSFKSHGIASTPIPSSRFVEEDAASPSELAKAYMGSRSSKVSPSMLGIRSQAFQEESRLPRNIPFTPKSPSMSPFTKVGALENGYITPRSRGRSAIYSMARTPYSRIPSALSQKDSIPKFDVFGGPSSSTQGRLEGSRLSGSKQVRGNYALDNDIGSIGPIRRIRQKLVSGSPLSGTRTSSKLPQQSNDITSFGSIPSQSSETAHKILQQLDKLVPSKDKSSELKLAIARKESPANLTSDMLNGQARKSLEDINFSRFLNDQDNRFDISSKVSLPENGETSRKQDKIEENGSAKGMDQINKSANAVNGVEAFVLKKDFAPIFKSADSAITNPADHPRPQKKRAFQMSAHEEFMDQDDDGDANGIATDSLAEERKKLDAGILGSKSVREALNVESPPIPSPGKSLSSSISNQNVDAETFDGSALTKKSSGFSFTVLPATSMPIQQALPSFGTNSKNNIMPKEPNSASPVFNFSSDNVDKVPPVKFSSTSIFGTFQDTTPGASSRSIIESSSSSAFVAGRSADATGRVPESDKADKSTEPDKADQRTESDKADQRTESDKADQSTLKAGDMFRKTETAFPSVTSTSSTSLFTFGSPANNLSANNGLLSSSSSTVSSPAPVLTFQNSSPLKFPSTSTVFGSTSSATAVIPAFTITSASSTPATTTTSPVAAISSFGSPLPPVSSVTPDIKNKQESPFGNLGSSPFGSTFPSIASTGSSLFGFSAPAATATSTAATNGGSLASTPLIAETGSANFTNSIPVQFGSSTTFPSFGFGGTSSVASNSSPFGSSTAPSTTKLFSSGVSFGLGSSTSASSEANAISSSSAPTPSMFGSSSNSSIPTTGFSFGGTSTSITASNNKTPTGSLFSFTLPAANTSSSTSLPSSQPVFGNPNPAFTFGGSGNNDQMSMEDTMAEDTQAASLPPVQNFGQSPPITPSPSSGFVFGSTASPFQFGGQQNPAVPFGSQQNPSLPFGGQQNPSATAQNPFQFGNQQITASPANQSPFQASGSVDFNGGGGGSFSLGSGGGDKTGRRIVKVKRNVRKK